MRSIIPEGERILGLGTPFLGRINSIKRISIFKLIPTEKVVRNTNSRRFNNIFDSMNEKGFDSRFPVEILSTAVGNYIINGHHRVKAAKMLGITEIPVINIGLEGIKKYGWESIEQVIKSGLY